MAGNQTMDADSLREHGDVLVTLTMLIPGEKVDSLRQRYDEKRDNLNVKLTTSKEYDPKIKLQEVNLHGMRKDVHLAERKITAWLSGKKVVLVYTYLVGYILRAIKHTSVDKEYYGGKGIAKLIWFKAKSDVQEQRSMKLYVKCLDEYFILEKELRAECDTKQQNGPGKRKSSKC